MRIHHAFDFSEPRVGVPGTLARWGEEAPARGMASASLASILLMHHEEEFSPTRDLISLRSAPLLSLSPHPLLILIQRSAATKDPFKYPVLASLAPRPSASPPLPLGCHPEERSDEGSL
jgi:hypothetical protein